MRKLKITNGILGMLLLTFILMSCKENKKELTKVDEIHSEMDGSMNHMEVTKNQSDQKTSKSTLIVEDYLKLKNALVKDNKEAAAKIGESMVVALENFDASGFNAEQQKDLKDIIEDAKEHAEHIAKSPIDHQREHFETLSKDMIDLVAITGTSKTLFQDFCPMYNNGKGGIWLSELKEIRNPYFGNKMLTCGSVQKVIE